MIIEEFIKEFEELKRYKRLYESQLEDKQKMSDRLYDLMMEKYESEIYEDRCKEYQDMTCDCCQYKNCCKKMENLPEDILKPRPSDKAWIPSKVGCGSFEWS